MSPLQYNVGECHKIKYTGNINYTMKQYCNQQLLLNNDPLTADVLSFSIIDSAVVGPVP